MTGVLHIVLARKPVEGTIAENCLRFGCGALNVDGCRVKGAKGTGVWGTSNKTINRDRKFNASPEMGDYRSEAVIEDGLIGRFPANLILGGKEVAEGFPDRKTTWVSSSHQNNRRNDFLGQLGHPGEQGFNDSGSAARFFFNFGEQESDE